MLINLKLYAICGAVIITLVSCSYLYLSYRIEKAVNEKYVAKIEQLKTEQLQNLQQLQHEQNVIVTGYIDDIERLKAQHEADLKELENANFKDTVTIDPVNTADCGVHQNNNSKTTVPTAGVKSDLICYTRTELQSKIAESMAITKECDDLALKYKALVEVCTKHEE
ncbi:MAG: hypothetical protein II244_04545 [Clostridia bacterium]|nr:hypothetical protein [Clostridia bacterium]